MVHGIEGIEMRSDMNIEVSSQMKFEQYSNMYVLVHLAPSLSTLSDLDNTLLTARPSTLVVRDLTYYDEPPQTGTLGALRFSVLRVFPLLLPLALFSFSFIDSSSPSEESREMVMNVFARFGLFIDNDALAP